MRDLYSDFPFVNTEQGQPHTDAYLRSTFFERLYGHSGPFLLRGRFNLRYHVEATPLVDANLFARPPPCPVENVKEVLHLSAEQKGALVSVGELTVHLNKLSAAGEQEEPATLLTNGNAANGTSEYRPTLVGARRELVKRPRCDV